MDERAFEHLHFLRLWIMDFDDVIQSIVLLEKVKDKAIRYRLIRDIAVTYSRAFLTSKGQLIPRHRCRETFVPKDHISLHMELINLRNQRLAHTDFNRFNPKISRWKTRLGWRYQMSFRGLNYEHLEKKIPDIEQLAKRVRESLQNEITSYEEQLNMNPEIHPVHLMSPDFSKRDISGRFENNKP